MNAPTPLDLLYPPRCIICQKLTVRGVSVCPDCARELCTSGDQEIQHGDFFDICYSPLLYVEPLRASFLRYKFNSKPQYAKTFGKWMADCIERQENAGPFDLVTWAPLSRRRRRRRGYDQAKLLAEEVASRLGLSLVPTLKKAQRAPLSGVESEKSIRSAAISGAYSLRKGADVRGLRILLVDDIITTGATLCECSRVLLSGGAVCVVCLTLARRPKHN